LRAGRPAAPAPNTPAHGHHAPHAALLIDFDNVTLGIRSDLTKELRTLLNSDIIRGKVAVQRAYADWRRYPQYIVPLSESSIDLIFAPAFGTNKKNATDIRLAVDAIELVFTRPEIGTIILLSGDSDFSSLVIKLKEYGKYVIGVGIRESASDLLIQNCDEYYSYSDLAGLTKEADTPSVQRDPWELVGEAVEQMSRNGDVMRSDRLKQVMQQIDPNFDERNAGFNRFSKFVTVAGEKGLIKVSKLDNGQFEVAPVKARAPAREREAPARVKEEPARGEREEGARRGRGRGRSRGRGREDRRPEREGAERKAEAPAAESAGALSLAAAFQLLTRAMSELPVPVGHESLRARLAALLGREDALLDPARFQRLLRQANDAEVADVRKLDDDTFEVSPHKSDLALPRGYVPAQPAEPAGSVAGNGGAAAPVGATGEFSARAPALRFRRGSRSMVRPPDFPLIGMVQVEDDTVLASPAAAEAPSAPTPKAKPARRAKRAAAPATSPAEPVASPASAPEAASPPKRRSRPRAKKKAE
jgi:uncharacterized protein (TIGR00288 family)